jgi:hypothetical protein
MERARSFRTTLSQTAVFWLIFCVAMGLNVSPPAFVRSLWHPMQYCSTKARGGASEGAIVPALCCWGLPTQTAPAANKTTFHPRENHIFR